MLSVVIGACIYTEGIPCSNIFLELKLDDKSKFKYSVGVYEINGDMIGPVACQVGDQMIDRRRQCKLEIDLVY